VKKTFKNIFKIFVYFFALWGFLLTGVFFAMKFGLTKTNGHVDTQSEYFKNLSMSYTEYKDYTEHKDSKDNNNNDERVIAAEKDWKNIKYLSEWQVIKIGLTKDASIIDKVSQETGVDSRLLIAPLVTEQLRLMTSQREIFKKYFAPLGILGTQTQFSLGIFGIKENTAKQIENNLKDTSSIYYLGEEYENILDYSSSSDDVNNTPLFKKDTERIKRLTNSKDHYYSYLYAALYLKQIITSWQRYGYNVSNRPEIIATLYNLGFEKSNPNPDPKVGGADIDLNGNKYSFGAIAFYFYFSNDLIDIFPR
jgi:hypothetical protein